MKCALCFVVLLYTSVLCAQTKGLAKIAGTIKDPEGAAIEHARVLLHWDPAGNTVGLSDNVGLPQDLILYTERDGTYSASVPPGFYDVFVTSMAFTPIAGKVRVKAGAIGTFSGKLPVDPLVSKELAD